MLGEGLDSSQREPIWGTAVVCLQENRQTADVHRLPSTKPPNQTWTYSLYHVLLTYLTVWVVLVFSRRWTWRLHITKSALSKAMSTAQPS